MIEHLPKETEVVRGLLLQAKKDFPQDAHKSLSDYVLGEEATETAAGFVSVLAPKIVEMLTNAKAAASLPALLAGDSIYDENGVPTILIREGVGVWGTITEILDDQVIDLYIGTEEAEDFADLYDALDGLEAIRFRRFYHSGGDFLFDPTTVKTVTILDPEGFFRAAGDRVFGETVERCAFVGEMFSLQTYPDANNNPYPTSLNQHATLDLSRTAASWHDFRYRRYIPGNPVPQWDWVSLNGWYTIVCPDGTITHDDDGGIILIDEEG